MGLGATRRSAHSTSPLHIAGAGVVILIVLGIYVLRLNNVMGQMIDDAWYVVLGKSLADGTGFRLISSATVPIQPLYPPGFPAILSLVFRFGPGFPENIWLLKSVSIAAMVGVGLLTYLYLHRHRQLSTELAACAAVGVTMTPALVFLATSTVMSECVFMVAQLAAVLVVHWTVDARDEDAGRRFAILAAVLTAGAMLIRSAAVTVVLAALLWFLKERLWRRAAWFGAVAVLCLLPWTLYARFNASTAAEREAHGGAVVYPYVDQLSMRWAGAPVFGRIALSELPARIRTNFVDVFTRGVGGILVPTFFRGVSESGEEVVSLVPQSGLAVPSMGGLRETAIVSVGLSLIALVGFVRAARDRLTAAEFLVPLTLGMIVLWPFWSFRFVLPLTPFLLFYFGRGIQVLAPRAAGIVLLSLLGLNIYDHVGYILHARAGGDVSWIARSREVDALLEWMNTSGLPEDGLLVTTNPGLVYLSTGRRSVASDHPTIDSSRWKERGVRYVAVLYPVDLSTLAHREFKVLYHSAGDLWVIEI